MSTTLGRILADTFFLSLFSFEMHRKHKSNLTYRDIVFVLLQKKEDCPDFSHIYCRLGQPVCFLSPSTPSSLSLKYIYIFRWIHEWIYLYVYIYSLSLPLSFYLALSLILISLFLNQNIFIYNYVATYPHTYIQACMHAHLCTYIHA